MSEKPILFSGEMVRAILAGHKTQTRRIVKPQPHPDFPISCINCEWYSPIIIRDGREEPAPEVFGFASEDKGWKCPYGAPDARLWVRETFQFVHANSDGQRSTFNSALPFTQHDYQWIEYAATPRDNEPPPKWKPSIFMPRWASRITIKITGIRVERLQDISADDARAEGISDSRIYLTEPHTILDRKYNLPTGDIPPADKIAIGNYRGLWEAINGKSSWDANPWVWIIVFKQVFNCPAKRHDEKETA
jgi:hypothetical protein